MKPSPCGPSSPPSARVLVWASSMVVVGCAGPIERDTRRDLQRIEAQLAELEDMDASDVDDADAQDAEDTEAVELDGSLERYLAYAYAHSPALRASFEEWRAQTEEPRQERRLPEPTLTYAFFIRSVETRVGPQRHRLGVSQWFPWPTKLTAGGKAAALAARSAQRRFEAHALDIGHRVSRAYWNLWRVERAQEVEREQIELLRSLSEQVRAKLEVGSVGLADLSQIDLGLSRAQDRLAGLKEAEHAASAELVRVIGAPPGTETPIERGSPALGLPAEGEPVLQKAASEHPRVDAMALMSEANEERSREAKADRFPSFGLGVDWIITGDRDDAMVDDSGKDAVIAMASIKVPLWQRSYGAAEREAEAKSAAFRARKIDAEQRAVAELERTLSEVRDSARRVRLYETTLVPQAETTYGSVQASYQSGGSTVAEVLMAEQALLELQLARLQAEAEYATAWSALEAIVGRPVPMEEVRP